MRSDLCQTSKATHYVIFSSLAIMVVFLQLKTHNFASPPFNGFAVYSLAHGYSFTPYKFENTGFSHLPGTTPG